MKGLDPVSDVPMVLREGQSLERIERSTMISLIDTFNGRTVSRHRSIEAAHRADVRLQRALRKGGSPGYLPTAFAFDKVGGPGIWMGPNTYYGVGRLAPVEGSYTKEEERASKQREREFQRPFSRANG